MAGCVSCQEAVAELVAVAPLLSLAGDDAPAPPCPDLLPSLLAKADQRLAAASESVQLVAAPTVDAETVFPVFRTGNYAPVHDELTEFDLPVEGSIPAELNGWYLRNGPNPRAGEGHWCVGDGMVHGVRLENGRAAWYRNRWVRTESFESPVPLVQRRRQPKPALQHRQHPRRPACRKDPGVDGILAALRDQQRPGNVGCLRFRRHLDRLDDGTSEDLPQRPAKCISSAAATSLSRMSAITAPMPTVG